MITFDHLKLVRRQPTEVKRLREHILGLVPGVMPEALVLHEKDDSCCRREPWNDTWAAIYTAVKPPIPIILV